MCNQLPTTQCKVSYKGVPHVDAFLSFEAAYNSSQSRNHRSLFSQTVSQNLQIQLWSANVAEVIFVVFLCPSKSSICCSPTKLACGFLTVQEGYRLGVFERVVPPSRRAGSPSYVGPDPTDCGNPEFKNIVFLILIKIKIRVAQIVGKVWILSLIHI